MHRYLHLFINFAKYSWLGEMEYRLNFVGWVITGIFWGVFAIVAIDIVYSQVNSIAGWTRPEALVFAGVHSVFISLLWSFILPSLNNFSQLIERGDLDFLLLKPVSPRFLVSFRTIEFDNLPRGALTLVFIAYVIHFYQLTFSPVSIILSLFTLLFGVAILYNFYFFITTFNIWFVRIFNLENLFDSIHDIGRYPSQIFKGTFKLIMVYLIPSIFIATYPTMVLLHKSGVEVIIIAAIFALSSLYLSNRFWHFALRRYSSASS